MQGYFEQQKKILICPLDWGLGHVTRSLALAKALELEQHVVCWALPEHLHAIVYEHFPEAKVFNLPAYAIHYSAGASQVFTLVKQIPRILKTIKRERIELQKIQHQEKFDVIVSDHRYGCYVPNIHSVFLAHQLQVLLPQSLRHFQTMFNSVHRSFLLPFDEIWIPDTLEHSLSGKLSQLKTKVPQKCIGPLSRFQYTWPSLHKTLPDESYVCVGIVSGPEPHRTLFVDELFQIFKNKKGPHLILTGQSGISSIQQLDASVSIISNLSTEELRKVLQNANEIHCRSGYSSIMDMHELNLKANYYPTPGQTEQEYLTLLHPNQTGK